MRFRNLVALMSGKDKGECSVLHLRPGETVQVRSEDEIAATLDKKGAYEGLPFMPTMGEFFGREFRVLRRADKIMIEGIGVRHVRDAVVLEGATCNGGVLECRRTCFILWKEAWLKRTKEKAQPNKNAKRASTISLASDSERTLNSRMFSCQSRNLMDASIPFPKRSIRRYMYNFTSGVYSPLEYIRAILAYVVSRAKGTLVRFTADSLIGQPNGTTRTPTSSLGLQPGDAVKVKSREEIFRTLDRARKNRGLRFTLEMEKYCGRKLRVLKRLDKMIIEQTGETRQIANTVLLEGAFCDGKANEGCPRNCYCLWREIWLEKALSSSQQPATGHQPPPS